MNRKPVVFVSSTYFDLKKERLFVRYHLTKNQYLFSGMEEFFFMPMMEQWENIKRTIEDCDIYVVILGQRFGSIATEGRSCTELEWEYAAQIGKPIIVLSQEKKGLFWYFQSPKKQKKQEAFKNSIACEHRYMWRNRHQLMTNMFKGIREIESGQHLVGYGRDLIRERDFKQTPRGIRLKFEYSDNTTALDKQKRFYEEIYYYEVDKLSEQAKGIQKELNVSPDVAIYCFLKHYILEKFKDKEIVPNGLYVNDHDMQNALIQLGLE